MAKRQLLNKFDSFKMIVQIILFLINIILINTAFLCSFLIRYGLPIPQNSFSPYKDNFVFLTFIYLLSFVYTGVLKNRFVSFWDLFERIFTGMFFGTLFGITLIYVFRVKWASFPSSIFVISFLVGVLIIFAVDGMILRLAGRIRINN